jgi:hypothetical protein
MLMTMPSRVSKPIRVNHGRASRQDLQAARQEHADLNNQVSGLSATVADHTAQLDALRADGAQLREQARDPPLIPHPPLHSRRTAAWPIV